MRKLFLHLSMAGAAVFLLAQPSLARAQNAPAAASGRGIYQSNCAKCHGKSGGGSMMGKTMRIPDLRSRKVQAQSDTAIAQFISEGKRGMPPFENRLTHPQILSAVQYIRTLAKKGDTAPQQ